MALKNDHICTKYLRRSFLPCTIRELLLLQLKCKRSSQGRPMRRLPTTAIHASQTHQMCNEAPELISSTVVTVEFEVSYLTCREETKLNRVQLDWLGKVQVTGNDRVRRCGPFRC
jgi:hypothetical protein